MKKRIVCAILALILMIGLVPAGAVTASAASHSVSESAITVLKQLEGYSSTCNASGYVGYGTKCTKLSTHGSHKILEADADLALRAELKNVDAAVNQFATSNGLSLTQSQFDALVLFTYDNGNAWMQGSGNMKSAVTAKMTGREFLTRICTWNPDTFDDNRRMVEANMYLNGKYSSTKPSNFFRVRYNAVGVCEDHDDHEESHTISFSYEDENGNTVVDAYTTLGTPAGDMAEFVYQYYTGSTQIDLVPSKPNHIFLGWYDEDTVGGRPITIAHSLHSIGNGTLVAHWQPNGLDTEYGLFPDNWSKLTAKKKANFLTDAKVAELQTAGDDFAAKCTKSEYTLKPDQYDSDTLYFVPNTPGFSAKNLKETVTVLAEYVDSNNIKWGYVEGLYGTTSAKTEIKDTNGKVLKTLKWNRAWVKLGELGESSSSTKKDGISMDVTVTVTNTYVRSRKTNSIYGAQNGTYYYGAKLRIINTAEGSGFLWGQVAKSDTDNTGIGWVALMYTNFDEVKDQDKIDHSNDVVVGKATITVEGYVNVRDAAGTDGTIVAAIPNGTVVELYDTKYVNGQQWGRCSTGWFCLSYAKVTNLNEKDGVTSEVGFTAYAFNVTLANTWAIYDAPDGELIKLKDSVKTSTTITNVTLGKNGITWGKTPYGWVKISNADGSTADEGAKISAAKFQTIADNVTVRNAPSSGSTRLDSLSKGVEFKITKLVATSTTIWGWADKFGESTDNYYDTVDGASYGGWVNLANKYVQRNEGTVVQDEPKVTGLIATVVGTDNVNVRIHCSMYSKILGQIPMGTTAVVLPNDEGKDGWYKLDLDSIGMDVDNNPETDNWVVAQYLNVREGSLDTNGNVTTGTSGTASVKTGKGIIANTYSGVNVRQTPGIGGAFLGKILPGTAVEVTQVKTVGTTEWGKVAQGWICMDYVTMLTYEEFPDASGSTSSGNTVTEAQPAIYTGYTKGDVTLYKTTDVGSDVVRHLTTGDAVTIHEILTVEEETQIENPVENNDGSSVTITKKTVYWARTNGGYLRNPGDNLELDALDEAVYTLTEAGSLIAYANFDLTGGTQFTLSKGDQVRVTNVKISGNRVNGFIEMDDGREGWVDLSKMSKGALTIQEETTTNTDTSTNSGSSLVIGSTGNTGDGGFVNNAAGFKYTGRVIHANTVPLNVRAQPSDAATVVTTLPNGSALVIYETRSDGTYAWGRCDAGWVYLYYVDLTPVGSTAYDAKVVFNDNTIVYTDAACTAVAATLARMSVVDIYEENGKMVRTDMGWVNSDNLLS